MKTVSCRFGRFSCLFGAVLVLAGCSFIDRQGWMGEPAGDAETVVIDVTAPQAASPGVDYGGFQSYDDMVKFQNRRSRGTVQLFSLDAPVAAAQPAFSASASAPGRGQDSGLPVVEIGFDGRPGAVDVDVIYPEDESFVPASAPQSGAEPAFYEGPDLGADPRLQQPYAPQPASASQPQQTDGRPSPLFDEDDLGLEDLDEGAVETHLTE